MAAGVVDGDEALELELGSKAPALRHPGTRVHPSISLPQGLPRGSPRRRLRLIPSDEATTFLLTRMMQNMG